MITTKIKVFLETINFSIKRQVIPQSGEHAVQSEHIFSMNFKAIRHQKPSFPLPQECFNISTTIHITSSDEKIHRVFHNLQAIL